MADAQKTGTDWQDEELDAIVADYFAMLALDAAGQPFVKAHRARALMEASVGHEAERSQVEFGGYFHERLDAGKIDALFFKCSVLYTFKNNQKFVARGR